MHETQICEPSWLITAAATEHVSDTCAVRCTSRAEEFLHPRFHSETKKINGGAVETSEEQHAQCLVPKKNDEFKSHRMNAFVWRCRMRSH